MSALDATAEAFLARYTGRDGKDVWATIKEMYEAGRRPLLLVPQEVARVVRESAIPVIAEVKGSKYLQGTTIYILDKEVLEPKSHFIYPPLLTLP